MIQMLSKLVGKGDKANAPSTSDRIASGHVSVSDSEALSTSETLLVDDADDEADFLLTMQIRDYTAKAAAEERARYFQHKQAMGDCVVPRSAESDYHAARPTLPTRQQMNKLVTALIAAPLEPQTYARLERGNIGEAEERVAHDAFFVARAVMKQKGRAPSIS